MLKSVLSAAFIAGALLTACSPAETPQNGDIKTPAKEAAALSDALLDPNTVSATDLAGIEGLSGPVGDAVLQARPFVNPSALHAVILPITDPGERDAIYSQMFVRVDANTASEADLKLIPSPLTPKKLAHEIDEYRPYADMRQFESELGKYMDDADLADLSRYVFVK